MTFGLNIYISLLPPWYGDLHTNVTKQKNINEKKSFLIENNKQSIHEEILSLAQSHVYVCSILYICKYCVCPHGPYGLLDFEIKLFIYLSTIGRIHDTYDNKSIPRYFIMACFFLNDWQFRKKITLNMYLYLRCPFLWSAVVLRLQITNINTSIAHHNLRRNITVYRLFVWEDFY